MAVTEKKEVKEVKKPSPSDLVIGGEEDVKESGEVVVDLEKKDPPVKETPKAEEYVRKDELEKERRRIAYEIRTAAESEAKKLKAEIEELKRQKLQPQPPSQPANEWDEKVQKNWKGTVEELADLRAEAKIKEYLEKERVARAQEQAYNETQSVFKESLLKVTTKHPELNDMTSEKTEVFRNVLEKNPRWKNIPDGPILAMREMEDELRSKGYVDEPTKATVDKEIERRARAGATTVKPGTSSNGNKVILTKDERDFCDHNNIKYDSYAASKVALAKGREIEA